MDWTWTTCSGNFTLLRQVQVITALPPLLPRAVIITCTIVIIPTKYASLPVDVCRLRETCVLSKFTICENLRSAKLEVGKEERRGIRFLFLNRHPSCYLSRRLFYLVSVHRKTRDSPRIHERISTVIRDQKQSASPDKSLFLFLRTGKIVSENRIGRARARVVRVCTCSRVHGWCVRSRARESVSVRAGQ